MKRFKLEPYLKLLNRKMLIKKTNLMNENQAFAEASSKYQAQLMSVEKLTGEMTKERIAGNLDRQVLYESYLQREREKLEMLEKERLYWQEKIKRSQRVIKVHYTKMRSIELLKERFLQKVES